MRVIDCLDNEVQGLGTFKLDTSTIEEAELLGSVAALLYKTKSVRACITIIDTACEAKDLNEFCEEIKNNPYTTIVGDSSYPYSHSSNL